MSIIFYGYKRCKTSREVEKALTSHGLNMKFIDIINNPPDKRVLKKLVEKYGVEGVVRAGKAEAKEIVESEGVEEFLERLRRESKRLVRPIVIVGGEVYAGRDALKIVGLSGGRRASQ